MQSIDIAAPDAADKLRALCNRHLEALARRTAANAFDVVLVLRFTPPRFQPTLFPLRDELIGLTIQLSKMGKDAWKRGLDTMDREAWIAQILAIGNVTARLCNTNDANASTADPTLLN